MKAVLIPIQPLECELIAQGKKGVIVTKRKPTLETPFKGYIYCTAGTTLYVIGGRSTGKRIRPQDFMGNRKVVGEFVCDRIEDIEPDYSDWVPKNRYDIAPKTLKAIGLTQDELWRYGDGRTIYGWHISNLKIYDKPKELGEFTVAQHEYGGKQVMRSYGGWKVKRVTNWCYVEEI